MSLIQAISDSCIQLGAGGGCMETSGGKNTGASGLRGEEVPTWRLERNRRLKGVFSIGNVLFEGVEQGVLG